MPSPAYATAEDEFWYNVSPQDDLPLAGTIDLEMDLESLFTFFAAISQSKSQRAATDYLVTALIATPNILNNARQFIGLSDKRAYLDLSYIASRTPHPLERYSLSGCHPWTLSRHPLAFFLRMLSGGKGKDVQVATAKMVAEYLIKQGLYEASKGFSNASAQLLELIYTRLIIPKEYQQKAAKRRGHGCEAALALVLQQCGADVLPPNKAANPMGASDPHLDLLNMSVTDRVAGSTHAFDMLVMQSQLVRVAIQSLIHTSDPGQYGVDKSNETVVIADNIAKWSKASGAGRQIEFWGLVDGVGFSENKTDTINKLLRHFHYFLQLRTLYKAPLKLHSMGLAKIKAISFSSYYDAEDIDSISKLYVPKGVTVLDREHAPPARWTSFKAGEATIYI